MRQNVDLNEGALHCIIWILEDDWYKGGETESEEMEDLD